MRVEFDDDLLEAAIALWLADKPVDLPPLKLARFHREREKLYAVLDPDDRNTAFSAMHREWFCEFQLDRPLLDVVREFPLLDGALALLAFRKPRRPHDEGAELYVNGDAQRHAVVALGPARLVRAGPRTDRDAAGANSERDLTAFLRHELMHLHDMVDPVFQYEPHITLPGSSSVQRRLAGERYRLLWDLTIDGRLAQAGRNGVCRREVLQQEFERTFHFWSEARRESAFRQLWGDPRPTHPALCALLGEGRDLAPAFGPAPGAPCPLCGFPTFDWAGADQLGPQVGEAIVAEFPSWTPAEGACGRCADIYGLMAHAQGETL